MKGSGDIDLIDLTPGQAEQFAKLEELWPAYGHSLQVTAAMTGGMAFRKVDGVDYLTRYTQEDGKKKGKSLGRRSPETEARLAEFENTVLKARRIIKQSRDEIGLACRLAKAHGSARLHGRFAEALDWLWYTDAIRRVALFGGSALLGYESATGTLASPDLFKEPHLQFVSRFEDPLMIGLAEIAEACGAAPGTAEVTAERGCFTLSVADRTIAEVFLPSFFLNRVERDQADAVREGLETGWIRSLMVSRDCRPIEACMLDPRAYAVVASLLADDDVWTKRAEYAVELVKHRWPEPFSDDQEAMIGNFLKPEWPQHRRM